MTQQKVCSPVAEAWKNITRASLMDPFFFQQEVLGYKLAPHQKDLFTAIAKHDKVVVVSGNGMGKTFSLGGYTMEYLCTRPHSIVLTTAPGRTQVVDQLWGEIRKNYDRAVKRGINMAPFGKPLTIKWEVAPKWYAEGLAVKVEASGGRKDAVRLQGYHAPYMLLVIDEASGVAPEIWESIDRLRTTANVKIVAIGNPNFPTGPFRDAWAESVPYNSIKLGKARADQKQWVGLHWPATESPNVITPNHGIQEWYEGFTKPEWIEEMAEKHGRASPWFAISVLGEFPEMATNALFDRTWLFEITDAKVPFAGARPYVSIGIDVARFGGDKTIFCVMDGPNLIRTEAFTHRSTTEIVGHAIEFSNKYKADSIAIDDTGVGGGVTDMLRESSHSSRITVGKMGIHAVNNAGKAIDENKYANLGTQVWASCADACRNHDLSIPKDKHWGSIISDLIGRAYSFDSKGRMILESKDDMKKRGLPSPDYGDAFCLCHWAQKRISVQKEFFVSARRKMMAMPMNMRGGLGNTGYGF